MPTFEGEFPKPDTAMQELAQKSLKDQERAEQLGEEATRMAREAVKYLQDNDTMLGASKVTDFVRWMKQQDYTRFKDALNGPAIDVRVEMLRIQKEAKPGSDNEVLVTRFLDLLDDALGLSDVEELKEAA